LPAPPSKAKAKTETEPEPFQIPARNPTDPPPSAVTICRRFAVTFFSPFVGNKKANMAGGSTSGGSGGAAISRPNWFKEIIDFQLPMRRVCG